MFCTKCGKRLSDEDKFCGYCGARVKGGVEHSYDDVVFNPPFRREAEKKTEEILKSKPERDFTAPKIESIPFEWNLEGFPDVQPKKTDEVDFNWDSVIERKSSPSKPISVEKIEPAIDKNFEVNPIFESLAFFGGAGAEENEKPEPAPVEEPRREWEPVKAEPTRLPKKQWEIPELRTPKEEEPLYWRQTVESPVSSFSLRNPRVGFSIDEGEATRRAVEEFRAQISDFSDLKTHEVSDTMEIQPLTMTQALEKRPSVSKEEGEEYKPKVPELKLPEDKEIKPADFAEELRAASEAAERTETQTEESTPAKSERTTPQSEDILRDYIAENSDAATMVTEQEITNPEKPTEIYTMPQIFTGDDKFNTYNQKRDAFQELLEKEKERLEERTGSYKQNLENMDYTWVGQVFPELKKEKQAADVGEVVCVAAPAAAMTIDKTLPEEEKAEEENLAEPEAVKPSEPKKKNKEVKEEKAEASQEDRNLENIFTEEAEPVKRHLFAKTLIAILSVLLLLEGTVLIFKLVDPDGAISRLSDEVVFKAVDFINGLRNGVDSKEQETPEVPIDPGAAYLESIVEAAKAHVKTIGDVSYDESLKYSLIPSPYFDEIAEAEDFVDADWYDGEDGNKVTYGQELINVTIKHYDAWQDNNDSKKFVGINKLDIGEIKMGAQGFYMLTKVIYADKDGKNVEGYNTVYLQIVENTVVINSIEKEKI